MNNIRHHLRRMTPSVAGLILALVVQQDAIAADATLSELKALGSSASKYLAASPQQANDAPPSADIVGYRQRVEPVLRRACIDCHGSKVQEGNVRIDTLDPDLFAGADVSWWVEVLAVLTNGEMPPTYAEELDDEQRTRVIEWLSGEVKRASATRRSEQQHTSFRRLTRYEYGYALQDLLGLPFDFGKDLPPESQSEDGFVNSSETLRMSPTHLAAYREAARRALERATVRGDAPDRLHWAITMEEASAAAWEGHAKAERELREKHKDDPEALDAQLAERRKQARLAASQLRYENLATGLSGHVQWNYGGAKFAWTPQTNAPIPPKPSSIVAVIPPGQRLIVELGDRVPDEGPVRVRARVARSAADGPSPSLRLEFGWQASNDSRAFLRLPVSDVRIDALPGAPEFVEWIFHAGEVYPRNLFRKSSKLGDLPSPSELLRFVNSSVSRGDVQIDYVEVTAPAYETWPPESHTAIFFDSSSSADEFAYARELLARFMPSAWRREVRPAEIDRKVALYEAVRPHCDDFQDAMIEVLASVLTSPNFLYLDTRGEASRDDERGKIELSQHEMASRLAVFLWCSIPDEELLGRAARGALSDPETLRSEVRRMIDDARSRRFSERFVRQWLGMELLDYLEVDRNMYPGFNDSLREAMQEEPVAFFQEVLKRNGSLLDFIHCDHTVANERLAKHYGIPGVEGNHFRRVEFPAGHHRGGLLTQSGLLAMNSDGTDSHPLKRGVWMLARLLNDPPPPPPPAVPEIDIADPEIAKMTLKERLEDHRNDPACLSCHAKIDPWGVAFENFDAVGAWRDELRGKPVDAAAVLFNGDRIHGVEGLKRNLLEKRQDQFVRAVVDKMATFALGRPLAFGDRSTLASITARLRQEGDGLATLVTLIATSDLLHER